MSKAGGIGEGNMAIEVRPIHLEFVAEIDGIELGRPVVVREIAQPLIVEMEHQYGVAIDRPPDLVEACELVCGGDLPAAQEREGQRDSARRVLV